MNISWIQGPCALLLLAATASAPAADVGVSIAISQPGVYGRIDIGRFPAPAVVVAQPVVVQPIYAAAPPPPAYLWVPEGHRKHWAKHCHRYGACGVPVLFVRDAWYHEHVAPKGKRDDRRHGHGKRGERD